MMKSHWKEQETNSRFLSRSGVAAPRPMLLELRLDGDTNLGKDKNGRIVLILKPICAAHIAAGDPVVTPRNSDIKTPAPHLCHLLQVRGRERFAVGREPKF